VTKHHHDGLTPFQAAALAVTADASRRAARATEEQNELLRRHGRQEAHERWLAGLSDEEYEAYIEQQVRQAEQQSQRATTISFVLRSPRRAEHLQPGDVITFIETKDHGGSRSEALREGYEGRTSPLHWLWHRVIRESSVRQYLDAGWTIRYGPWEEDQVERQQYFEECKDAADIAGAYYKSRGWI
jgi:hypothetical protein